MRVIQYDKATAEALFSMSGWPESVIIRDDGVFLNEEFCQYSPSDQVFDWTPAYDMDWAGSPNPMTAPVLPIPFTANELAACMLDGPGHGIQCSLDRRVGYPLDDDALKGFTMRQREVANALRAAYTLAAEAQSKIGEFDYDAERKAQALAKQADDANGDANAREGVFERGITRDEANQRRARAVASVGVITVRAREAMATAKANWFAWRKAMVQELLHPKQMEPDEDPKSSTMARMLAEQATQEHLDADAEADTDLQALADAEERLARRLKTLEKAADTGLVSEVEKAETAVAEARQAVKTAETHISLMRGDDPAVQDIPVVQVEVASTQATPAPASQVATPEPLPLTTGDIAFCFDGIHWSEEQWRKPLGWPPLWLKACIAIPGRRGGHQTRWNPVLIGAALVQKGHAARKVRSRFQSKTLLAPWLDAWKTYEADYLDND